MFRIRFDLMDLPALTAAAAALLCLIAKSPWLALSVVVGVLSISLMLMAITTPRRGSTLDVSDRSIFTPEGWQNIAGG